jgi:hypothetical protein
MKTATQNRRGSWCGCIVRIGSPRLRCMGPVADRMDAIAEEVLAQVGDRLPPELRVLDAVQQLQSRWVRWAAPHTCRL